MTFKIRTAEEVLAEGVYAEKILVRWSPRARSDRERAYQGWWATLHFASAFGLAPQTIAEGEITTRYGEPDPGSALRFVLGLAERMGIRRRSEELLPVFYEQDDGVGEPDYEQIRK